jgi:hypothetical protein
MTQKSTAAKLRLEHWGKSLEDADQKYHVLTKIPAGELSDAIEQAEQAGWELVQVIVSESANFFGILQFFSILLRRINR